MHPEPDALVSTLFSMTVIPLSLPPEHAAGRPGEKNRIPCLIPDPFSCARHPARVCAPFGSLFSVPISQKRLRIPAGFQ